MYDSLVRAVTRICRIMTAQQFFGNGRIISHAETRLVSCSYMCSTTRWITAYTKRINWSSKAGLAYKRGLSHRHRGGESGMQTLRWTRISSYTATGIEAKAEQISLGGLFRCLIRLDIVKHR